MVISDKRRQHFLDLMNDQDFQAQVLQEVNQQREDPLKFSRLPYWLTLDGWTESEGLLVLVGMDPDSLETDPLFPENWTNGLPFYKHESFLFDPYEFIEPWNFDRTKIDQELLESIEEKRTVLNTLRQQHDRLKHKLARSVAPLGDPLPSEGTKLYSPAAFVQWADSLKLTPSWLGWAKKNGYLEKGPQNIMSAPYFDADSPDYPFLLHIAVRAWEHARTTTGATPKQRLRAYLDKHYPHLPSGSKEAISQVANWNRTGGRPPENKE